MGVDPVVYFSGVSFQVFLKMYTSNRNAGRQHINTDILLLRGQNTSLWDRKPMTAGIMCPSPDMPSGAAFTGCLPFPVRTQASCGGFFMAGWLESHPFYFLFKEP